MRSKLYLAIAVASALSAQNAIAEYKTKSHYSKNYKCVAEEAGGYNHDGAKHHLARFRERNEYFLTHISRLPIGTLKNMRTPEIIDSFNGDESLLRKDVERVYLAIEETSYGLYEEEGAYFFRNATQDPLTYAALLHSCRAITVEKDKSNPEVVCDIFGGGELSFSTESGRFVVASPGNWIMANDETPDSSYFEFGTCKEYYN